MLGRTIEGAKAFEVKLAIEKELIYASGSKPIDLTMGNEGTTGSLTLLGYEWFKLMDAAQAAGYPTILHVPHTAIVMTCSFKLNATAPMRLLTSTGVGMTDFTAAMAQNAKFMDVPLPFLATGFIFQ